MWPWQANVFLGRSSCCTKHSFVLRIYLGYRSTKRSSFLCTVLVSRGLVINVHLLSRHDLEQRRGCGRRWIQITIVHFRIRSSPWSGWQLEKLLIQKFFFITIMGRCLAQLMDWGLKPLTKFAEVWHESGWGIKEALPTWNYLVNYLHVEEVVFAASYPTWKAVGQSNSCCPQSTAFGVLGEL